MSHPELIVTAQPTSEGSESLNTIVAVVLDMIQD